MKLKDLGDKYVVHCKTLEEAINFLKIAHEQGFKWCTGGTYIDSNSWDFYEHETCYYIQEGSYGSLSFFKRDEYKIFDASLFLHAESNITNSLLIF